MKLSIVIPCYNEEKRIRKTLKKIIKYMEKGNYDYELIIVDDGSTDNTIKAVSSITDKAKILRNRKNRGKGYSVRKGFLNAKKDYVLFTDADLSTPIAELKKLEKYIQKYDIVIGSRKMPNSYIVEKQPFYRILAGNIFPILVRIILNLNINDTQCGFKLFNRKKCIRIFKKLKTNGFSFDAELLYRAKKSNLKIKEIGVRWYNDKESKVKLIKHSFIMLWEVIRIRWS